jgi:hypothetical protein
MGQHQIFQRGRLALRGGGRQGRQQQHRRIVVHLQGGVTHARFQRLRALCLLHLQTAGAGLAALLHAAEQDGRLVGLLALAFTACSSALLAFALLAQVGFAAAAFKLGAFQVVLGVLLFLRAGGGVEAVVTAVVAQAGRGELHDALHRTQQLPVMADEQQAAGPVVQLPQQMCALLGVEVVARFVQDQGVGTAEPGAQQGHAGQLAAAQGCGVLLRVQVAQALGLQIGGQALPQIPLVSDEVEIARISAARFDARECVPGRPQTCEVQEAHTLRRGNLLRQVEHASRRGAAARGRRQLARQDAREQAFTHAVAADQAGRTGVQLDIEVGKQGPAVRQDIGNAVEREQSLGHEDADRMPGHAHPSPEHGDGRRTWSGALLTHRTVPRQKTAKRRL